MEIKCKHKRCLNHKQGCCMASSIDLDETGWCVSFVSCKESMHHDYDIVHKRKRAYKKFDGKVVK